MIDSGLATGHEAAGTPGPVRQWLRLILSRPQQVVARGQIAGVFAVCITGLALVLVGETAVLPGVTLGSYALLAVLIATWTLPTPWASAVAATAVAVVIVAVALGSVDPVTGGFQLTAVVVVAVVSRLAVIALQRSLTARSLQADELRRLNTRLVEFTADAAHELRAPLAVMRAVADRALDRPRVADEYRESLTTLQREVIRLSELADTLLILARADDGNLVLQKGSIDVADFLSDTAARWQAMAETHDIALELELPEDGAVAADQVLLMRLFDNLLDNACRYTPPGGSISLAAQLDPGGWHLSVSNTGAGIPVELREEIFERFKRGDASRTRETGGAGLGLALCQTIARLHGGEVRVEQPWPLITRFAVDLP
jgi:signal transduction histidine kinase